MHAVSTNQTGDILHFNHKGSYISTQRLGQMKPIIARFKF